MDLRPEMAEQARKKFYGDRRFSDFTVKCHGKEYHVHRVLVSTQSKWFEACCTAPFKEAADKSVTLHEDDPVAVEKMFEFFYQGTYNAILNHKLPRIKEKGPSNAIQLHAYVYVVAEKYDCPSLKQYALDRFRDAVKLANLFYLKGVIFAVYQQLELPESDRTLKTAVLQEYVSRRNTIAFIESDLRQLLKEIPEFAEDLAVEYLRPPSLPSPTRAERTPFTHP